MIVIIVKQHFLHDDLAVKIEDFGLATVKRVGPDLTNFSNPLVTKIEH